MNKYLKLARRRTGLARFERESRMVPQVNFSIPEHFIEGSDRAREWAALKTKTEAMARELFDADKANGKKD